MTITKSQAIAIFALFLLMILVARMPQEETDFSTFENMSNGTQDNVSENSSLRSTTDDMQTNEEPGWWKHEGRSTVTSTNATPDSYPNTTGDDNKNDTQEIPEFPTIVLPVMITLSMILLSGRK